MITTPPLHIDFVVTFNHKYNPEGYWFIAWIKGKNRLEVWRKKKNREWSLEAGTANDMDYRKWAKKDDLVRKRKDVFYREIDEILAIPEKASELDDILFAYMINNGFPYKSPYKYWPDPHETHPDETYC